MKFKGGHGPFSLTSPLVIDHVQQLDTIYHTIYKINNKKAIPKKINKLMLFYRNKCFYNLQQFEFCKFSHPKLLIYFVGNVSMLSFG